MTFVVGVLVGAAVGIFVAALNGNLEYERGFAAGRIRGARETRWTAR